MPVVWATQVLDQLARTGMATRAEVTDAAMSERAECVMLNKGPYIAEAVTALIDILGRMEDHQYKKRSLYRRLHLALPEALKSLNGGSQPPSTVSNGTNPTNPQAVFGPTNTSESKISPTTTRAARSK
jgi:pyruvate kinase